MFGIPYSMYSINRSAWTVPGQCDHVGLVMQYWQAAIEKLWSRDEKDAVLQLAFSKSLRRPELDAQLHWFVECGHRRYDRVCFGSRHEMLIFAKTVDSKDVVIQELWVRYVIYSTRMTSSSSADIAATCKTRVSTMCRVIHRHGVST